MHNKHTVLHENAYYSNQRNNSLYRRTKQMTYLLWSPYGIGQAIIFLPCDFYLLSIYLFSSLNLSSQRLVVYHTSTHCVALVQI